MSGVQNNNPIGNNNQPPPPDNTNQTPGTPDPGTVDQLNNQLNQQDPSSGNTPDPSTTNTNTDTNTNSNTGGITSADMKNFMDAMNKFCIQQGIQTAPDPTDS